MFDFEFVTMAFFNIRRKINNRISSTRLRIFQFYLSRIKIKKLEPNHQLDNALIVSITSYPPRFKTLHLTIICLLKQTIKPNAIVLWVAESDIDKLPKNVTGLVKYGLAIKKCDDIRSFKKIIPTLKEHPDAFIVTADDDLFYWETWLEELVLSYIKKPIGVICHRAHKVIIDNQGHFLPYSSWQKEIPYEEESVFLFPTSGAGVLYSPNIFFKDIVQSEIFMKLTPTADDVWLYWMHCLSGSSIRTLGAKKLVTWFNSQKVSLYSINCGENLMNDLAITNMYNRYGAEFLYLDNDL